eukprot:2553883-Pleurochrysis_carterae.AAC.1
MLLTPLLRYLSPGKTQMSAPVMRIGSSGRASTRARFRKRCSVEVPLILLLSEMDSENRCFSSATNKSKI